MGFSRDSARPVAPLVILCLVWGSVAPQDGNLDGGARGLFPVVFNLATRSRITANATCGEREPEVFCKLVEHVRIFPAENSHCDVCDSRSENPLQRHPITNAIDGSHKWWQSPSLTNGVQYNYVTITLDLGSIYQVAYVIVKAANSPRPGNWILERSIDGQTYKPWQYFAMTDEECWSVYGVRATVGVPVTLGDDEVICTSRYSRLIPLENGEIFVSIVNGRPGVFQPSRTLLDFTSARYVRLRMQRIRTLNADLMVFERFHRRNGNIDPSVTRRYYYSIKDISIGGQCICYGHATYCRRHDVYPDRFQCQCLHDTGGDNCEKCLPLFNQKPWRTGGIQGVGCEECNCHGKAVECVYNATIDSLNLSLNKEGKYEGGGVCLNCQEFTTGINCEHCIDGYYRPQGYSSSAPMPCRRCNCRETATSTGQCVPDDSRVDEGLNPGDCICKPGYGEPSCQSCAFGYSGYPSCRPCPCNPAGSRDPSACSRPCNCKPNVGGSDCGQCRPGYYNLDRNNPDGCTQCFCFGVTTLCRSANWGLTQISDLNGWVLSTVEPGGFTLLPRYFDGWLEAKTYLLNVNNIDVNINNPASTRYTPTDEVHFWLAPMSYLGNRLSSYGGRLKYTVKFTLDSRLTNGFHLADPDVILRGANMTIAHGRQYRRENLDNVVTVGLMEDEWYHLDNRQPVSRREFMTILYDLQQLLIKATYHASQDTVYLRDVSLDVASPLVMNNRTLPSVEQCQCPEGYAGLSCESCAPGWRREGGQLYGGVCRRCECYNHASECDPYTGACLECKHNTAGDNCERCLPGFFGDPRRGTENDCRPCACPLVSGNNFFAEYCVARPTVADRDGYECVNCQEGYEGVHCERCSPGYYGDPTQPGGLCRKCNCGGNIDPTVPGSCDPVTGACIICSGNTEGEFCERCKRGYYGSAVNGDCRPCECRLEGSSSSECDQRTGQCYCRERFTGRRCDRCQPGYGDVSQGCVRCSCSMTGSISRDCDAVTGQCQCRPGIGGKNCDRCAPGYYGYSQAGCLRCDCYGPGTNDGTQCDPRDGRCICLSGVVGQRCDQCQAGYYGIDSGRGCIECDCNRVGATSYQCDQRTGQCSCRPGVGGRACDQCQPGYYGFSRTGCRRCEPCTKPGHICDPDTGACVCPPNTFGPRCERCETGTYDYDSMRGCKRCNCTEEGSASQECDAVTGVCTCLPGFRGFSCDACVVGYYGFPKCDACLCNATGTEPESCQTPDGVCACDGMGQCDCKANVIGRQCDRCREGTFSLRADNPKGCTECYCFFRSNECMQAPYVWTSITIPTRRATISPQALQTVVMDPYGYLIINSSQVVVDESLQNRPLYWSMPQELLGDKTLSYGGKLDFIHYSDGPRTTLSTEGVAPMVVLRGNMYELHGDVTGLEPGHADSFSIKLHENYWRLPGQQPPVSRRMMMVVLQNVSAILIRATQDGTATYAEVGPIGLQISQPSQNTSGTDEIAYGIEQCKCPDRYSGLSCQNPGPGYYRVVPNPGTNLREPEDAIGIVRPCQCFSHSDVCDPETGICLNCQHNTAGDRCEQCAPGFYGMATRGTPRDCQPCACPLPDNNFSPTCTGVGGDLICTNCSEGYTGVRCERCAPGYYGNPAEVGSKCQPCNCDPSGSLNEECDHFTGQCLCISGIEGRRCDRCPDPRQGVQNGACVSCYDGCTGVLLDDLRNMSVPLIRINVTGVVYPWEEVYRLRNETAELRERMDALKATSLEGLRDMKRDVDFLKNHSDSLYDRMNFTGSKVGKVQRETKETLKNATEVEQIVSELYKEIRGNISQLRGLVEKLYYNQSGVNVTAALKQAQDILNTILGRDFTDEDAAAKEENYQAERLGERIRNLAGRLNNESVARLKSALGDLRRRLDDLYSQTNEARAKAMRVLDEESQKLANIIADLEDKVYNLNEMKGDTDQLLKDGQKLVDDARDALNRLVDNINALERELFTLEAASAELERRFDVLRRALPGIESKTNDAWNHALQLERSAKQLEDLFAQVRDMAEDPMRAARAYESIVRAIEQAREAAQKALDTARETVRIANLEGLADEVRRSLARSRRLQDQADNLNFVQVGNLRRDLNAAVDDVNNARAKHQEAVDLLNMLRDGLDNLPRNLGARLDDIVRRADNAVAKAARANVTVTNIQYGIDYTLWPRLRELQDFNIRAVIENVNNNVEETKREAQIVGALLPDVVNSGRGAMRNAANLSDKIKDLRRKINEARNMTNGLKLSLSGEGNCVRSYRSQLAPGVTNEISMGVKLNRTNVNMLLLLLQESPQEYLALEIINNKVKFSWDVGRGQGSVTHDLELKVFPATEDEGEKWYHILAKRVGPIGQLKVWPVKGSEANAQEVTAKSASGFSLMNFNYNTSVFIAGVGDNHRLPQGVTRGKLYGCVGDITVENKPIGVYNFKTSQGRCQACSQVPQQVPSTSVYSFDGAGYATTPITSFNYNSDRFFISLEFKTFWENSRLFFAGKPQSGDFVSLDLRGGKIIAEFYLGGLSIARAETNYTYNTNTWTVVTLQRIGLEGVLQMLVDSKEPETIKLNAPGPLARLEVKGQSMYIGGLPETFSLQGFAQKSVKDNQNFLGCMRVVGFGGYSPVPVDLASAVLVGITPGCKVSSIHRVGFYGDGFVVFDGVGLQPGASDIALSFYTKDADALLLLARDVTTDYYYSIALTGGRLEARLSANSPPTILRSTRTYNDGAVHYIALLKQGGRIQMLVDDVLVAENQLPAGVDSIPMSATSNLYFGGAPIAINDMAASSQSLRGCISDIIADGQLIDLSRAKQYVRADIGRCEESVTSTNGEPAVHCENEASATILPLPPLALTLITAQPPTTTTTTTTTTTARPATTASALGPTSTCSPFRLMNAGREANAKTLGNSDSSFAQLSEGIRRSELRKNFNITFEFRTFYNNGLFGLLTNQEQTIYLAVQLRNGEMEVVYTFKGQEKRVLSGRNLADGQWHTAQVLKDKTKLFLEVDSEPRESDKIESRLNIDLPLYIGSLPKKEDLKLDVVKHSIRGCVRDLHLNSKPVDITDTDIISGVEHCYARVEPGVAFLRDSWGIFSMLYKVGQSFTVELEFRTSERDGIFVTITSTDGQTGMTLELHEGKVKFAVANEEGIFRAESSNVDSNALCGNQWHRVVATVVRNVVQLNVDGGPDNFGVSQSALTSTLTDSPLFIGGFPEGFDQVASLSGRGFYGCMRNLYINGNPVDWYDLVETSDVKRTACPL